MRARAQSSRPQARAQRVNVAGRRRMAAMEGHGVAGFQRRAAHDAFGAGLEIGHEDGRRSTLSRACRGVETAGLTGHPQSKTLASASRMALRRTDRQSVSASAAGSWSPDRSPDRGRRSLTASPAAEGSRARRGATPSRARSAQSRFPRARTVDRRGAFARGSARN
jgi:hypothetical protein